MILIVDDDPSVVASLGLLLKQHGYPSRAASSAAEALAIARSQRPSLVLQDMNFSRATSGEEGLELLGALHRELPEAAGHPDHRVGIDRAGGRGHEAGRS